MRKYLLSGILTALLVCLLAMPVIADTVTIINQDRIKVVVFRIGDSNYYLEDDTGIISTTKMDVAPYIKNGRTLVPARYLGNALGVPDDNITWNQSTKTATLQGEKKLTLVVGSMDMRSNGEVTKMDVAPEILPPGRVMLLARYVAEGLGFEVGWDANRKLVICWEAGTPQPDLTEIIEEIEDNKPVVPKPGQKVLSSAELKAIYKIFESKGYKVSLRPTTDKYINDYWSINIDSAKSDPNKDQFDADVYEQAKSFIGVEGAEWVKVRLSWCERPNTYTLNDAKMWGDKAIAVYMADTAYDPATDRMKDSDLIVVEFTDHRAFDALR